ncbi:DNA-binding winged helix-turn-helix (wHTH) protein [Mitsuaria sp. BK045]|uniref:GAF domain-containing protein n=1 Tax=unclassified Roseateles TaxID=2626991 RepID=UPI00160895BB|nr:MULTISPECIES: GAF domain-containing protein [unclassified Roseateles]MBB3291988.1 DNA-binding winged helix-turn-helix (wHTH) protein [Mitsuaria sp. BK041]MBB3361205.1 DNA-binding winged helix-turn-helix (wHTH) protein [Mitsuaria sp. BK045]
MPKSFEYHFADCRLNVATRELWLRRCRQQVEPRVLDFLICLIERRGRVVRKDELIAQVWGGEILTDSVLGRAASKARRAIGDMADAPFLVRTVHGVGYQFIGEVEAVEASRKPRVPAGVNLPPAAPAVMPGPPPAGTRTAATVRSRDAEALDVFALDDEVAAWRAALPAALGPARLDTLIALAWHLRQRDTPQALVLAEEASLLLLGGPLDRAAARADARLMLVRGEARWLAGQLHAASDLAEQAALAFDACGDVAGACDAALLRAAIAADREDGEDLEACVRAALARPGVQNDKERHALLQLQLALAQALRRPGEAFARWSAAIDGWRAACGPGVRAVCHYVQANWAFASGDRGHRLRHAMAARQLYAAVGQRRDVVRETGNLGALFANLFDNESALQHLSAALTEARAAGWPLTLAACLAQSAAVIGTLMGRPADAIPLLDEASGLLVGFPGHRVSLMTLRYRGDLQLALGQHATALPAFEQTAAQARRRGLIPFEIDALIGEAKALSGLGQAPRARESALQALRLAEASDNDYCRFLVFEALAGLWRDHPALPHDPVPEASVVLHYLLLALEKQGTDNPGTPPPALLEALAAEYARLGDYVNAYAHEVRGRAARAQAQSAEADGRAIAMKIRHDTEQAQADSEHHRALAAAHAERAEALTQTNAILARLGTIGQEITRHLDAPAIFDALARHVHGLLDASSLAVFLLDADGRALELAFGTEAGGPLPDYRVALDDACANAARCARERREIHVRWPDDAGRVVPGTQPTRSALFAPLSIGDRLLGVLTVQSPRADAYGEREHLILRTLSAYSAVALGNAAVYRQLESARDALALTHAELIEREGQLRRALGETGSITVPAPLPQG